MCGREGTFDGQPTPKSSLAEELLLLENIDILVLTETHSIDFSVSCKSTLLGHTGISSKRAGVAIISSSRSGWYCTDSHVLIDGYALLLHLHHCCSAESLWILGVYSDISDASRSLRSFYSNLADALTTVVLNIPDWHGCFAAGDWNFVLHLEDHIPTSADHRIPFRSDFDYLLDVWTLPVLTLSPRDGHTGTPRTTLTATLAWTVCTALPLLGPPLPRSPFLLFGPITASFGPIVHY